MPGAFEYFPAGPIVKAFHESKAFFRGIRGPVGSSKSTALAVEVARRIAQQQPGLDGIRRSRWAVVRNTEPQLRTTTIKTFTNVFPTTYCRLTQDSPITLRVRAGDIDAEIYFIAMDEAADERKLLSLELTGIVFNEARELSKQHIDIGTSRVGRYPSAREGGCTWSGCIADTNPPDQDSWWYDAEQNPPPGWQFFTQPSGLSPAAENLHNLNQTPDTLRLPASDPRRRAKGREYYERLSAGKSEDWLRVFVHGECGFSLEGRPVLPEFGDSTHTAPEPLTQLPRTDLIIGLDPGLGGSAAVFLQRDHQRWLVIHELIAADLGIESFGRLLRTAIAEYFPDVGNVRLWCDPASAARSQLDSRTVIEVLRHLGLPAKACPTNDVLLRLEAIRQPLSRLVEGKPGLLISPTCKRLRKALASGYVYRRLQISGREQYHDVPDKNEHSHVVDSCGYALLGAGEGRALIRQTNLRRFDYALT